MNAFLRTLAGALLALSLTASLAHANKSGVSPNVLSLPQGPGSLGGVGENVQANLNMGLMSYSIQVLVPKGRGTATPNPSITYSSSAGAGLMGIGWSFSVGGAIERATVRGLPTYTNKDSFYAGGELVKIPNSPFYRARMEGGFVRYRWVQSSASDQRGYWLAQYPDGSKAYYGANSKGKLDYDAQVYGTQGTFRWELVTKVDRNGNRIEYSYFKDASNTYPDQIQWVFAKDGEPLYKLEFRYEDRPDHISDGKPGFDLKTKKRLKQIQITSAGTRFRSYSFQYEDATGLSRLLKVTRYGRDASKAYPVSFSMKYSDANFSAANSKLVTMPTSLGVDFRTGDIDLVDINGDGLPDVVDTSKPRHVFHINTLTLDAQLQQSKHDFSKKQENPAETSARLSNPSVQMLDVNGDGFTDIVDAVNRKIYLNKGSGKWEDSSDSLQNFPVTGKDPNMRFFDYNGDKKIDVLSSNGSATTYWVSDGKGNWKVTPGATNIGLGFSKDKLRLIDLNGDGLQDVVHITKNSLRYRKYLGYGQWTDWIDVKVPGIDQYELSTKAQFADINGDGMADMVAFFGQKVMYFVNKNGTHFLAGQALDSVGSVDIPDSTKTTVRIADLNGNGSRDIVWIDSSGKVTYLELFDKRPNLMTEISNGIGQRINVAYGSSVYHAIKDATCDASKDEGCAGPWKSKMPMAFTVVATITTWSSRAADPAGQAAPSKEALPLIQRVYYHDGFYDGVEKKFRGFRYVESVYDGDVSLQKRREQIYFHVGQSDAYFHGRMLKRVLSNGDGKIFFEERYEWKDCGSLSGVDPGLDPPVRFICQKSKETTVIEGADKSQWKTLRLEMSYDGYGNVTRTVNLGDKDKEGDELSYETLYIAPKDPKSVDSIWILNKAKEMKICDGKPGQGICAHTRYYYDGPAFQGLPLGQLTLGRLTRMSMKVDDSKWVTTMQRKYDEYGHAISRKGSDGQLRTAEWDAQYQRFPVRETIHLKGRTLTASTLWNYAYSKVIKSTDFSGNSSLYTYDVFGRLSSVIRPGDAQDAPSVRYTYELKAPISRLITESRSKAGGPFDRRRILCFDGRGRRLNTRDLLANGRYLVTQHVRFNRISLPLQSWDPYEADETCSWTAPDATTSVTYFYDAQHRNIKKVYADGNFTRSEYSPLQIRSFDQEDNRKDSPFYNTPTVAVLDGLMRMVEQIQQLKGGKTIATRYTYTQANPNARAQISSVEFPDGSKKLHHYDLLGNLKKVIDPDRKEMSYQYNASGALLKRKDAKAVVLAYTYDQAGRVRTVQQEGKPDTLIEYGYDLPHSSHPKASYLKGKLAWIKYKHGLYTYSYDIHGNQVELRHVLLGVTFAFKYEYNHAQQLVAQILPDGRRVELQRDGVGRVTAVSGFFKSISYHVSGMTKMWQATNGIQTRFTFDKRQRLQRLTVGEGKVMDLQYQYDAEGNILRFAQKHGDSSFAHSYAYDALYRLTQARLMDGKELLTYRQDDLYNITSRVSSLGSKSLAHIGAIQYDALRVHQATQVGTQKLAYDPGGMVTQSGSTTYSWDFLRRCTRAIKAGAQIQRSWYGSGTDRIAKEEAGVHSFYPHESFEFHGGSFIFYLKLGKDRVASAASHQFAATFFDDVGGGKADGVLDASDAWAYHATKQGFGKASLKPRPFDIDLTQDMLLVSAARMLQGKDKEIVTFYHPDHLGSVRAATDAKGQVISRQHYYPYGQVRAKSGVELRYAYMGVEVDKATQTYHFGLRSYDPKTGRWLSPDPLFDHISSHNDEFNSYGKVLNNPVRYRDIQGASATEGMFWTGVALFGLYAIKQITTLLIPSRRKAWMKQSVQAHGASRRRGAGGVWARVANRTRALTAGVAALTVIGIEAYGAGNSTAETAAAIVSGVLVANSIVSNIASYKFAVTQIRAEAASIRATQAWNANVNGRTAAVNQAARRGIRRTRTAMAAWGVAAAAGAALKATSLITGNEDYGYAGSALVVAAVLGGQLTQQIMIARTKENVTAAGRGVRPNHSAGLRAHLRGKIADFSRGAKSTFSWIKRGGRTSKKSKP